MSAEASSILPPIAKKTSILRTRFKQQSTKVGKTVGFDSNNLAAINSVETIPEKDSEPPQPGIIKKRLSHAKTFD